MPRFSIKSLLLATTLIAVGMALMYFVYQRPDTEENAAGKIVAVLSGGALIGGGIFTPFNRPWIGAILAVVLMFLTVLLLLPTVN